MNILNLLVSWYLIAPSGINQSVESHPIHVSICELRYNEANSSFQVSLKIFIDDLEVAIKKEGYPPLGLGSGTDNEDTQTYLASYLDKYFYIDIDGKKLTPHLEGKEVSEDFLAVWCYLDFTATVSRGQKCTITNRVLLDMYSDQRNIMDIRMSKTQSTHTIFDPFDNSWSYTF
ncbi:MAG: DUF6702 family protein [Saprospiraceae bacterium]